jgi:capsular polysaccharide export protein
VALAAKAGVAERLDFIDGGDLAALLAGAKGCVVVNSTVGLHALQAGCPVKCLGVALYDIPGLTHQGPLGTFWEAPRRPDPDDVAALVRVLAATIQVRGDFFSPGGRVAAVASTLELIESGAISDYPGRESIPPRLAEARRQGISVDPW